MKSLIQIPTSRGMEIICHEDILSICSDDKTVCICLENGQRKTVNISIGRIEKELTLNFFVRCHKCYIVNVLKIIEITNSYSEVVLFNGESIPVSRTYKKMLKDTIEEYCQKI